jgi:transglutaminase-like putative cysteine protease
MPLLTIRHVTTYRYRQPVALGEHRMMLRPRDSQDQRVVEARLDIRPEPITLRFVEDAFGNHLAIAQFFGSAQELCFDSVVSLEHRPQDLTDYDLDDTHMCPAAYSSSELPDLALYIERHGADPENVVGNWVRQVLLPGETLSAFEVFTQVTQGIKRGFRYRRREAKGIQEPVETLRLGQGSCRDFALLLIEAARSLGFAARFASGYLAIPLDDLDDPKSSARGSTHAWAQIYLPETGWISFDPTCGSVGNKDLVTVAVARDPSHTTPLHGTFIGLPSDPLGMDVRVRVTSNRSETRWAAASPQLSLRPN